MSLREASWGLSLEDLTAEEFWLCRGSQQGTRKVQKEAESSPWGPSLPQPDLDNIRTSLKLG